MVSGGETKKSVRGEEDHRKCARETWISIMPLSEF